MPFHLDDTVLDLAYVARRLGNGDLIPSQLPLRENLDQNLKVLEQAGVDSVSTLRSKLKSESALKSLASQCALPENFLQLLRRAVEGWFPKPPKLKEFPGVDKGLIDELDSMGTWDARIFFELAGMVGTRRDLESQLGFAPGALDELKALCDLSRLQWVSPGFARLLYDAGFRSASDIASSTVDAIYTAITAVNVDKNYYRGVVGKRDIGRLISVAGEFGVV